MTGKKRNGRPDTYRSEDYRGKVMPPLYETPIAYVGMCVDCGCRFMVNRAIEKPECVRCGKSDVFRDPTGARDDAEATPTAAADAGEADEDFS